MCVSDARARRGTDHRSCPCTDVGLAPVGNDGCARDDEPVGRTVLVVDDQAAFRAVVRRLLETDGFVVVGEAGDASTALRAARELDPDVVLLDVRLSDRSGIEVARLIRSGSSPPAVVLTSTADYAHAVPGCGAQGFVPKALLSGATLRAAMSDRPEASDLKRAT